MATRNLLLSEDCRLPDGRREGIGVDSSVTPNRPLPLGESMFDATLDRLSYTWFFIKTTRKNKKTVPESACHAGFPSLPLSYLLSV